MKAYWAKVEEGWEERALVKVDEQIKPLPILGQPWRTDYDELKSQINTDMKRSTMVGE